MERLQFDVGDVFMFTEDFLHGGEGFAALCRIRAHWYAEQPTHSQGVSEWFPDWTVNGRDCLI